MSPDLSISISVRTPTEFQLKDLSASTCAPTEFQPECLSVGILAASVIEFQPEDLSISSLVGKESPRLALAFLRREVGYPFGWLVGPPC